MKTPPDFPFIPLSLAILAYLIMWLRRPNMEGKDSKESGEKPTAPPSEPK